MTIDDVARRAGVSKSTVSRAFSRPASVHPRTRERVLSVAHELAYEPYGHVLASSRLQHHSIGLFVPDIANPVFPPLIKAVQEQARIHEYAVFLADSDEHADDETDILRAMAQRVDGLILASPRMSDAALLELAAHTSVVTIHRYAPGQAAAVLASPAGLVQAVEHLASLGHRRFIYLAGPVGSFSNEVRRQALQTAAAGAGIEFQELGPFEPRYEDGERVTDLVLALGATAVVAYNDLIALGLMSQLEKRGVRVGADVSLIGVDDIWLASRSNPPLTTVRIPMADSAVHAVRMLLGEMAGTLRAPNNTVSLATRLVVRGTTGPAPS